MQRGTVMRYFLRIVLSLVIFIMIFFLLIFSKFLLLDYVKHFYFPFQVSPIIIIYLYIIKKDTETSS